MPPARKPADSVPGPVGPKPAEEIVVGVGTLDGADYDWLHVLKLADALLRDGRPNNRALLLVSNAEMVKRPALAGRVVDNQNVGQVVNFPARADRVKVFKTYPEEGREPLLNINDHVWERCFYHLDRSRYRAQTGTVSRHVAVAAPPRPAAPAPGPSSH